MKDRHFYFCFGLDSPFLRAIEWVADISRQSKRIKIGKLSFTLSPSAQRRILALAWAVKRDSLNNHVPCLTLSLGFKMTDAEHVVFSAYQGRHLIVVALEAGQVQGFEPFDLDGMTFFVPPETVQKLNGKNIVMKAVPTGVPNLKSKRDRLLLPV